MSEFIIDSVIETLTNPAFRDEYKAGNERKAAMRLSVQQITTLIRDSKTIFLNQPTLLKLDHPTNIVGDIHGQFHDLLWIFEKGNFPPASDYLFLGDYVDRGSYSLETICLLLAYKIRYPENVFMLRGNHESASISEKYGFSQECAERTGSGTIWALFTDLFDCLPLAAVVGKRIFCCHGGPSPGLTSLSQIEDIRRPVQIPDSGLICDLVWSDPDPTESGWNENSRGVSVTYGREQIEQFLGRFGFDLICRAHQVKQHGYEFMFDRKMISIYSAPNYGNQNNEGVVLKVDRNLAVSFIHLKKEREAATLNQNVQQGRI